VFVCLSVRGNGHPDVKAEDWLELDSVKALKNILLSIIWVPVGQHTAVNFSQCVTPPNTFHLISSSGSLSASTSTSA
jgi:Lipoxygenase